MGLRENVAKICKHRGITEATLEKDLGYPRGTIAKWALHIPNVERVREVAEKLDATIDELVNGGKNEK